MGKEEFFKKSFYGREGKFDPFVRFCVIYYDLIVQFSKSHEKFCDSN